VRQAAFKGLRTDKPAGEIVAEKPAKAEKTEIAQPTPRARKTKSKSTSATTTTRASGPAIVMGVSISHPDKPLWPDEKPPIRKIELARYFEEIGDWMLPHIKGRPCSLVRTPDGIKGDQKFFQRHAMPGSSHLITQVKVRGDKKPYVQLDRIEALAAV